MAASEQDMEVINIFNQVVNILHQSIAAIETLVVHKEGGEKYQPLVESMQRSKLDMMHDRKRFADEIATRPNLAIK